MTLKNAYATKVQGQNGNNWVIYDKNENELVQFPGTLTEQEIMNIIRFGRKYEQEGALFGQTMKTKGNDALIRGLRNENERLSITLDRLTRGN